MYAERQMIQIPSDSKNNHMYLYIYIYIYIYIYVYIYIFTYIYIMFCPSDGQWVIWFYSKTQNGKVSIFKVSSPKISDNLSNILILAHFLSI